MPLKFEVTRSPGDQWHAYGHVTDTDTGMSRSFYESWIDSRDRERAVKELLYDINDGKMRTPRNTRGYTEPLGPWFGRDPIFANQIKEFKKLGLI